MRQKKHIAKQDKQEAEPTTPPCTLHTGSHKKNKQDGQERRMARQEADRQPKGNRAESSTGTKGKTNKPTGSKKAAEPTGQTTDKEPKGGRADRLPHAMCQLITKNKIPNINKVGKDQGEKRPGQNGTDRIHWKPKGNRQDGKEARTGKTAIHRRNGDSRKSPSCPKYEPEVYKYFRLILWGSQQNRITLHNID